MGVRKLLIKHSYIDVFTDWLSRQRVALQKLPSHFLTLFFLVLIFFIAVF